MDTKEAVHGPKDLSLSRDGFRHATREFHVGDDRTTTLIKYLLQRFACLPLLAPMHPRGRTRSHGRTGLLKHILNNCTGLDYRCKNCGQWLSTYHNSHKNHFPACKRRLKEAKDVARRIEKHGIHIKHGSRVMTLHHHLEPEGGNLQIVSIPEDGIHSFCPFTNCTILIAP